jgi:hypothetical protein
MTESEDTSVAFKEHMARNFSLLQTRAGSGCHVCDDTICAMSKSKCPECCMAEYLAVFNSQAT